MEKMLHQTTINGIDTTETPYHSQQTRGDRDVLSPVYHDLSCRRRSHVDYQCLEYRIRRLRFERDLCK